MFLRLTFILFLLMVFTKSANEVFGIINGLYSTIYSMTKRKLLKDEIVLLPEAVMEVFKTFKQAGFEIYLIGGAVRSVLLNKRPEECDFTTNATPEQILELTKTNEPYYENEFGTVMIPIKLEKNSEEQIFEITTYRSEKGYSDYRHPNKVEWGKA